jgi:hypothetical protein
LSSCPRWDPIKRPMVKTKYAVKTQGTGANPASGAVDGARE